MSKAFRKLFRTDLVIAYLLVFAVLAPMVWAAIGRHQVSWTPVEMTYTTINAGDNYAVIEDLLMLDSGDYCAAGPMGDADLTDGASTNTTVGAAYCSTATMGVILLSTDAATTGTYWFAYRPTNW